MNELERLLEDSKNNANKLLELIQYVETEISTLRDSNRWLQEDLESGEMPFHIVTQIEEDIKSRAHKILMENALEALEEAQEFKIPELVEDLKEAINNPDTIIISVDSEGYIYVTINLEETAGSIEDYADAITSARENFSMKLDAASASVFWAVLYKAGREGKTFRRGSKDRTPLYRQMYRDTMSLRKAAFAGLAPWWNILEYGNSIDMTSDRGGTPYPNDSGQHFVSYSYSDIKSYGQEVVNRYRDNYYAEIEERMSYNYRKLREYQNELDQILSADLSKPAAAKQFIDSHLNQFYSRERIEQIDQAKVNEIVQQIISGADPGRVSIGGDIRIRTLRLVRDYNNLIRRILGE